MDAHKNFAYSTVAVAPSPASSGTSLTVASGDGALFPATPFNATVWPTAAMPLATNAEVVRVTNIAGDVLTITRAQESSSARTVIVGDQIAATITAKTLTDVESAVGGGAGTNGAITGGSLTVNTSGISINLPAYLTTADLSANSSKYAGINGAITGGSITVNTSGVSVNLPAYLTTAALSGDSSKYAGVNGAITGGSITVNTSGVSVNLPAYLTTADLSANSSKYAFTGFTTTTVAGAVVAGTHNTAGLLLAVPSYLTTAALSANTSNYAGINSAITGGSMTVNTSGVSINLPAYLTTAMQSNAATISNINVSAAGSSNNLSAIVFSNSNNVTFGLNASTITVSIPTASVVNISVVGSSNTFGSVVFSNSNGYTFGLNAATVTLQGPSVGYLEPYQQTNTAGLAPTAGSWYLAPFVAPNSMSGGRINFLQINTATAGLFRDITGGSYVSSSSGGKNQSGTFSLAAALWSQGSGTNSTRLESLWSNSFSWGWSHRVLVSQSGANSSVSVTVSQSISYISEIGSNGAYTLNQFASNNASNGTNTSIASNNLDTVGVSLRNMLSNSVMIPVGFNSTISAGNYWLGVAWSTTTASATSQTSFAGASALWFSQLSLVGISRLELNSLFRNWGSTTTTARSGLIPSGAYSAAANMAPPQFIALSSDLVSVAGQWVPYFNFVNQGITK